ncbi:SDR family oxidoreductase [Virgibacillus salarius]|uniref:SDR family oxidoreductase n=1 Tax=Virgibacillus salarius TaxID=447199 RepID=UPI0003F4FDF1|nr:SDR family oxidoreductase [Priestia megaterium]
MNIYNLSNAKAIVTGVSHGEAIGAAICRQLAKAGSSIFFTHWKAVADWPENFQAELADIGINSDHMCIDLSIPDAPQKVLDVAVNSIGAPTILVNNAAHSERDGYEKLNASSLDVHYSVNMRSTMILSTLFARLFKKSTQTAGRIINLVSGQDQAPMIEELAYGATKGAISTFTVSLSAEVAPLGITVNAVNPGPTDTGWMSDEDKQELGSQFLMGRIGQPTDAARLVTFLASKESAWITGQVIHSEGAFLRK